MIAGDVLRCQVNARGELSVLGGVNVAVGKGLLKIGDGAQRHGVANHQHVVGAGGKTVFIRFHFAAVRGCVRGCGRLLRLVPGVALKQRRTLFA